ncbi:MAG: branched-chain amino acid ABC transporter permease [Candidatus Bipolaricaulota bacterium]
MELTSNIAFALLNGIVWGVVLALASSGLNVIYGLLGIVNVAHGSFYMLGAFFAWFVSFQLGSFWYSLVLVPPVIAILGIVVEFILRPVERNVSLSVLSTFAIMIGLQGAALAAWGGTPRRLAPPIKANLGILGTGYSYYRIFVALVGISLLLCLWWLSKRTKFGLQMRAARENSNLSKAVGLPVPLLYSLGFGLGTALAGLSGVLIAPMVSITPDMGTRIFAIVFLIVITGGLGNIWNSVVVAVGFSLTRGIVTAFFDPTTGLILTFAIVISLVLIKSGSFPEIAGINQ